MPPKNGYLYCNFKPGRKTTWLFLHGLGGDSDVWQPFKKRCFQRNEGYLAVDLPGHGRSYRLTKGLKLGQVAQQIELILEREKLVKVNLVGHCFGGMVGIELALLAPERIHRLILVNSYFRGSRVSRILAPVLAGLTAVPVGPNYERVLWKQFAGSADLNVKRLLSDLKHVGIYSYARFWEALRQWNRAPDLGKLSMPVLIVGGEKDVIFSPRKQRELAEKIPGAELVFLSTNHLTPLNAPDALARILFV